MRLTAMGTSMALVWNNLPVMLTWAAIMLVLIVIGIATGLLGMIVFFRCWDMEAGTPTGRCGPYHSAGIWSFVRWVVAVRERN